MAAGGSVGPCSRSISRSPYRANAGQATTSASVCRPAKVPREAMAMCVPFSGRSLQASHGPTSATNSAPAASHDGRGPSKRSITH